LEVQAKFVGHPPQQPEEQKNIHREIIHTKTMNTFSFFGITFGENGTTKTERFSAKIIRVSLSHSLTLSLLGFVEWFRSWRMRDEG